MLAFIVLPILEIWVLLQVGSVIGAAETFALVVLVSAVGAFMVRREGFGLMGRIQGRLSSGELPTRELIDGLLVVVAGALMLTPGFVTDGIGLLCLFPPSRIVIRTALIARYRDRRSRSPVRVARWVAVGCRARAGSVVRAGRPWGPGFGGPGEVIDVGDVEYDRPDDPPELDS